MTWNLVVALVPIPSWMPSLFVDNLIILINLFPWMGKVEQPIEVQTNLVFFSNIGYIGYKFSTPVIKSAAK